MVALVEAGFAALAERGLDGITMRDVAGRLGVQAPAIYWHLRNRQDLVDEMATAMWRDIHGRLTRSDPARPPDWAAMMTDFARVVRAEALARRDGARLLAGTYLTDDAVLADQQRLLVGLCGDRIDPVRVARAYVLVYSFTIGYVIEEQARLQAPDDRYDPARRRARLGGDPRPGFSDEVLATGDARFDDLLASLVETVRRELAAPQPRSVRE